MSFIFTSNATRPVRKEKIADWAGCKKTNKYISYNKSTATRSTATTEESSSVSKENTNNWKDVSNNIKQMDQTYDATFYAWLKSEENVLVTSIYLHRIANEYSLDRISNALEWLTMDWRWESVLLVVQHVTIDWCTASGKDDIKRAELLKRLTNQWPIQYIATLISSLLMSSPYHGGNGKKREQLLKAFAEDWDFSKLSEFFMALKSKTNIDYKFKCHLLQEAARKDRFDSGSPHKNAAVAEENNGSIKTAATGTTHRKRTNSNDIQESKKTNAAASSSSSTTTSNTRYRHSPPTRLSGSSSSLTISSSSSSSSSSSTSTTNDIPSPSTSTTSPSAPNNSDSKKRLSHYDDNNMKPVK